MRKNIAMLIATLLLLTTVFTACAPATQTPSVSEPPAPIASADPANPTEQPTMTTKDTIVIALQGEPTSLDAQYPDDGNMRAVTDNLYDCLMKIDGQTLEVTPNLATEMTMLESTVWELKLRTDVTFHDGTPFTAEDAVFSLNRVVDPEFNSQILSDFDTIKEAKVIDASTIQIVTHNPDPLLDKRLTKLVMLSKAFTEAKTNEELTLIANGTGPYKFVKWDRGVTIDLEANESYWNGAPMIKNASFRFLEEPATRLAALQAGEIDIAVNMYPEYAADLPKIFTEVGYETMWIRLNELSGKMVDKRMRLAANMAIDRQALADDLFLGYAQPSQGQIGKEGYFGYNPNVTAYPYDPAGAKKLLDEAGYNGEVIELVSERGRWLKDGEVTEAVAAMLTDAGFNVSVKILSWNEWLDTLFDKGKTPDMQFSGNSNEYFDMDRQYSALVHSSGTQAAINNAEYDKIIEDARSEMDPVKRQAMYEDLTQKLYDDPFACALVYLNDLHGGSANLNWTLRKDSRILISDMSFS